MQFFTSYYGNYKNIPKEYVCIGISRYCPEWFSKGNYDNFVFIKDTILAPDKDLLDDMKSGRETEEGYKRRYVEGLFKKLGNIPFNDYIESFSDLYKDYEAIVFLCYEKPDDFCHRHILRKLMNNVFHIPCEELETEKKQKETALF